MNVLNTHENDGEIKACFKHETEEASQDNAPHFSLHVEDCPKVNGLQCSKPEMMKIIHIHTSHDQGPVGRITRNQDFDIIGSKYIFTCHCGTRSGLDMECRRVACQGNNPGCKMNPPRCWPRYQPPLTQTSELLCPVRLCYANK